MRKTLGLALVLSLGVAADASAQRSGDGYMFHQPYGRITLRGGYALAAAGSDLFDDVTSQLTLNRRDFSSFTGGAELAVALGSRFDISIEASYARANRMSEFRDFVDNDDRPIEQTTTFERVPLMLNARMYLTSPGRSIGKLAWIPNSVAPWVGVGGGLMWYHFQQQGDFIDYKTLNVFSTNFESDKWAGAGQVMGGADFTITPQIAITVDSRYIWANGGLTRDFSGFNKIDLSGISATVGLTFRL